MKRISVFLMGAACLLAGCSQADRFTVQGNLEAIGCDSETDTVTLYSPALSAPLSAAVKDGTFTLKGTVEKPETARIRGNGRRGRIGVEFVLEPGTITLKEHHAEGTPLNDAYVAFDTKIKELNRNLRINPEETRSSITKEVEEYVKAHAGDPTAKIALRMNQRRIDRKTFRELVNEFVPDLKDERRPRGRRAPGQEGQESDE